MKKVISLNMSSELLISSKELHKDLGQPVVIGVHGYSASFRELIGVRRFFVENGSKNV